MTSTAHVQKPYLMEDVHFVFPDSDLITSLNTCPKEQLTHHYIAYDLAGIGAGWVVKTFAYCKQAGYAVTIGTTPRPEAINIIEPRAFGLRNARADCFIVSATGDAHRSYLAQFTVQQNDLRPRANSITINYWPQPGLIQRDPARGPTIKTLHFKGAAINLNTEFRHPDFERALSTRQISLVTGREDLQQYYRDYSDVDLVFAVRNLTYHDAYGKPANKLFNAWMAGVPALLGPEPPYQSLRQSPLDFCEVRNPADVLNAIDRLQAQPQIYNDMIENGLKRGKDFTLEHIQDQWITQLNGPIRAAFLRWKAKPGWAKLAGTPYRLIGERLSKTYHVKRARNGRRILD